jgi:hypothetical protein
MGDRLADYQDAGGVVYVTGRAWDQPGLAGRWRYGGYAPYQQTEGVHLANHTLDYYDAAHPLMQGIAPGALSAYYVSVVREVPSATLVAAWHDAHALLAVKRTNGHIAVGQSNYVGDGNGQWSGPYGRMMMNAVRWLGRQRVCGTPTLTPVAQTVTPTTVPPTTTRPPAGTPTNTVTPVLVGHVTWQGRPAQPTPGQQLPLTLTLQLGANRTTYPNQQTDAGGIFTVPVQLLPTGVYTWWVKGPQYLATSGTVSLTGAPSTPQEMGLQRVGDANNDNLVDITDFSLLRATFGKGCGDAGYDGRAEFTGDCLVDITDFSLLRSNFGQAGTPPP